MWTIFNIFVKFFFVFLQYHFCFMFFVVVVVFLFGCKEYNESDFGVDHLVMFMCRVFSCVVGRGCLLWPVRSLGKTLLALPCFILYSKAKFACYSRCFLSSYFYIPVPYNEKDIFLGVSSRRSCRSSQNHSTSASEHYRLYTCMECTGICLEEGSPPCRLAPWPQA